MDGKLQLPKYIKYVYSKRYLSSIMVFFSHVLVALTVAIYVFMILAAFLDSYTRAVGLILVTGIPFAIVTLVRRRLSARRPYEVYDVSSIPGLVRGRHSGESFPSRHVFCAFIIGTHLSFIAPVAGATVCIFGLVMGTCRVLLGIHFVKDVAAGALIGIVSGIIGGFIVNTDLHLI